MQIDVIALRAFYASPLGKRTLATLLSALERHWPTLPEERLVGLGFTLPFLDCFKDRAERAIALMPARQGAVVWPSMDAVSTALVFEEELPLPDSSVDRILLVHSLEFAENAEEMLKEMWRVLAPNGRLVLVVPNRRGLWARYENTPFGFGEPYSGGQLQQLLHRANFIIQASSSSLYYSPSPKWFPRIIASLYGHIAARFFPYFGGVIIVEAQKRLYQGVVVNQRQSRRVFVPALSAQPTTQRGRFTYEYSRPRARDD